MNPMASGNRLVACGFAAMLALAASNVRAQTVPRQAPPRDSILAVAREVMAAARYGALITVDSSGRPRARLMDPFPPEADMSVWLATNPRSRKVSQLRANPRATLYYFDPATLSYVTLTGVARLVDDAAAKASRWKDEWEMLYPDRDESYLLIEVVPVRVEVVSFGRGLTGDPVTWTPDGVTLGAEP